MANTYVQITRDGMDALVVSLLPNQILSLTADLENMADERELGHVWTVKLIEMTEEEFAELPEFDGW